MKPDFRTLGKELINKKLKKTGIKEDSSTVEIENSTISTFYLNTSDTKDYRESLIKEISKLIAFSKSGLVNIFQKQD